MNTFTLILAFIVFVLQLLGAIHALIYKKDPRAAWAWIVICLALPPLGSILYFLFGINRVRLKAKKIRWFWPELKQDRTINTPGHKFTQHPSLRYYVVSGDFHHIARISDSVSDFPLVSDNNVEVLYNGESAYPAMLTAIKKAKRFIHLETYIFEKGHMGKEFVLALVEAQKRGVDVKIIIDGIGEWYSYPPIGRFLQKHNLSFVRFLPPRLYPPSPLINLRNHRKILIVDGEVAFTGGMNISDRHLMKSSSPIKDVHFRLTGPIVIQLEHLFCHDWFFCSGQSIFKERIPSSSQGKAMCRAISVGPDDDLNSLTVILIGAISEAKESIYIMNPYFLPTREIIGALQSASLRGVDVRIVLPEKNNIPFVHWATRNMLWELLIYGIRVYYQPPPFCHSKLFVVDNYYCIVGSANLDYRSLRLNFELVVETFCKKLGSTLSNHILSTISTSRELSLHELDARPFLQRIRDSLCWLFTPYL